MQTLLSDHHASQVRLPRSRYSIATPGTIRDYLHVHITVTAPQLGQALLTLKALAIILSDHHSALQSFYSNSTRAIMGVFSEKPIFDPTFVDDDADIVLQSRDGIFYGMHKCILRTSSGFFRTMLSLPSSGSPSAAAAIDSIVLDERSGTLGILLRMISGLEVPKWACLDVLEDVLEAAQKYDMSGPASTIRAIITTPLFLDQPLRLYALAARSDWEEEAKFASRHTLDLSIHDKQHLPMMDHIPSAYLIRLIEFHRERRDQFQHFILQDSRCFGINKACTNCGVPYKNGGLGHMAKCMVMSMDMNPLGSELVDGDWKKWIEAMNSCCGTCDSSEAVRTYSESIQSSVNLALKSLPSTI